MGKSLDNLDEMANAVDLLRYCKRWPDIIEKLGKSDELAEGAAKAEDARKILQKYGIDINDAENGVFLPIVIDVADGVYHPSLHTSAYYDEVNNLLKDATSKREVLDVLSYISELLQDGTFMKQVRGIK